MKQEIWKDIPNYEGIYQMSNKRRIKSLKRICTNGNLLREKFLNFSKNNNYDIVCLAKNNTKKIFYVDKLYYELFEKEK